jgi:hypothetical protein
MCVALVGETAFEQDMSTIGLLVLVIFYRCASIDCEQLAAGLDSEWLFLSELLTPPTRWSM